MFLVDENRPPTEFHPDFFFIKDRDTKNVMLKGECHRGLYPLPSTSARKQTFGVNKPSLDRWHSRLGHPATPIVECVLRDYKLHLF
jgi:hypothetical protein